MRRYLVFVEHDIVVRHFLKNGSFDALARAAEVVFVFPEAGGKRLTVSPATLDLPGRFLTLPIDAVRQVMWRWLFYAEQLRWRSGSGAAGLRHLRWATLGWKAALLLTIAGLPGIWSAFNWWIGRRIRARPAVALESLLDRERPDAIVHPSVLDGVFINDLVESGKVRGIPVVALMNSWDNPSTKRAVVGHPDWLGVWGEQSRRHAMEYMGMASRCIVELGAAQFDVFNGPPRQTRTQFCRLHDADEALPLILYAGSSKQADEYAQLEALEQAIEDRRVPRVTLIYRPHPWGGGGLGGERIAVRAWRHVRLESTMRSYLDAIASGSKRAILPDYRDTHDVLSNVDAVVSPLSTILIEAAMHGKPVMCQLPDDEPGAAHFRMARELPCFRDIIGCPSFIAASGRRGLIEEFPRLVLEAQNPNTRRRMIEAARFFVAPFDRPWRTRLVEFMEEVVVPRPRVAARAAGRRG
jgi:hypothetical protein